MSTLRLWHAATLLANGRVLVVGGGYEGPPDPTTGCCEIVPIETAELYQ